MSPVGLANARISTDYYAQKTPQLLILHVVQCHLLHFYLLILLSHLVPLFSDVHAPILYSCHQ